MGDRQLFVKVKLTEDEYQMLMKLAQERGISAPFTLLEEGMPKVVAELTGSQVQVEVWPNRALELLRLVQELVNESSEIDSGDSPQEDAMLLDRGLYNELQTVVQVVHDEALAKLHAAAREQTAALNLESH